jgi:UDP-N-acetylglucosamine:LPS N-acetylglucosamine transferase
MTDRKRILFAISDTGGGHRSGAQALQAALQQHPRADTFEYRTIDLITATGLPLLRSAPGLYDQLSTKWLPLFDLLYQVTNGRRRVDTIAQIAYVSAARNIRRELEAFKPDIVVSVHPLANRFIGHARRAYHMDFHFITVVTDLVSLHMAWGDLDADLCVAPTHEGRAVLLDQGMPAQKVVYAGFPVHPKFTACTLTVTAARSQLGIDTARSTVLLTAGGVGSGRLREVLLALHAAYPALQILVVTGRNVVLRTELQRLDLPAHIHIYGFVDNMEVLMAASDTVVTKAGPGTLMEALVMRRPVVITEAVGMQERGNIDFVVDRGLGAYAPQVDGIVAAVGELMVQGVHDATVARLGDAVPRDGAKRIAELIVAQLELAPPVLRKHAMAVVRLPEWARRNEQRELGSRRLRVLSMNLLKLLRENGATSINWRGRGRKKQKRSTRSGE